MTHYNARLAEIAMPPRIRRLRVSETGYPVPWFCQWLDGDKPCADGVGVPDLRLMGHGKIERAVRQSLCWVCGDRLGAHLAFTIGPMCTVNRISAEPPSHRECAEFSVRACPFLSQPRMRRNEADKQPARNPPGVMLAHNPGVVCVWVTRDYRIESTADGPLFKIGEPEAVAWFHHGRGATRPEIIAAFDKGLPSLRALADRDDDPADSHAMIDRAATAAMRFVPHEGNAWQRAMQ